MEQHIFYFTSFSDNNKRGIILLYFHLDLVTYYFVSTLPQRDATTATVTKS